MYRRIIAILRRNALRCCADHPTLIISLIFPLIQLVLFGFAISMNVKHIPTAVVDQSMDAASRAYINEIVNSQYFDVVESLPNQAAAKQAVDNNTVQAAVIIPTDFQAKVERGEATALILVDGADPFVSLSAYNNANIVAQAHAVNVVIDKVNQMPYGSQATLNPLQASIPGAV